MELRDGFLRLVVATHFHKRESARPSCGHVAHDPDALDLAGLAEKRRQLVFCGRIRKVPDVESATHLSNTPTTRTQADRMPPLSHQLYAVSTAELQ
jgi:hypothetical protein